MQNSGFEAKSDRCGELLAGSRALVDPATYSLVSLTHDQFSSLISDPARSPSGRSPYLIFSDKFEVTLVLEQADLDRVREGSEAVRVMSGYRLLTFDAELPPDLVGFLARVSGILADAGVPVIALSAFSRDHLLIRQGDLPAALRALGPFVAELC